MAIPSDILSKVQSLSDKVALITPGDGSKVVAHATGATLSLTAAAHAFRKVYTTVTDGLAITLPEATGSGDKYEIFIGATIASASTIKVSRAADTMLGIAYIMSDDSANAVAFVAGATADTIDLLGTANSTGGLAGSWYRLTDIAANLWAVEIIAGGGGTEATPFSATVA